MSKLLKYLKTAFGPILVIIALLVLQAWCDLSLPAYTSDIINVGISQSGVDSAAPTVITESDANKLLLLLNEKEQETFKNNYEKKDRTSISADELKDLKGSYEAIEKENIYLLKDNADKEAVENALSGKEAYMYSLSLEFEQDGQKINVMEMTTQSLAAQMQLTDPAMLEGKTVYDILATLDQPTREQVVSQLYDNFIATTPDMVRASYPVMEVASYYKAAGIDLDNLQLQYVIRSGVKMLGVALLAMVATVLTTLIAARVASQLALRLRREIFGKVVSFSSQETDHFSTASLITRSTNDIQQVQMLVFMMLRMVLYAPILGVGGVIKVTRTNASLSWIIALAVGCILAVVLVLLVVAMPKFNRMQKLVDRMNLVTREILTGLPVIRAFSTEKHEEKRFDGANTDLTKNTLFTSRVMAFMFPIMMFVMSMTSILIVWFGAKSVDTGSMQIGDIVAFTQYAVMIVMSFLMLTMVSIILPRASVAAKRIDEVITTPLTIHDPEKEEKIDRIRGTVAFNHVNFAYPNADEDALSDITFTARPGETTAIIGSTGCGKSTLVNLIPRLYDVKDGSITIDGMDIRNMSQHELRDNIGFVPQKGILFSGTIDSNLRYGRQDASEEVLKKAAEIAQATEFIESKPEKYDSEISQGGTNVSGGQKQRLSIARAIAKQPPIYIFDDSFSALDYKTDVTLRKALKEETGDSTVIIVAQRISTILHADQIIVLEDGKIAGIGTHRELLKNNEVYRQIALSQLSEKELKDDLANDSDKEVTDHE
ncbi:MAG: ABC transporter ATP-binding protein [bacterium]|nr:ABC transporter ATP-binding protein [bacterium]